MLNIKIAINKYRLFIILFCNFFFAASLNAQEKVDKGWVLDAFTKEPVAGASVFINASGIGTVCDAAGQFSLSKFIQANLGNPNLTIAAVGYETATYNLTTRTGEVVIYLKPVINELETVVVHAAEKNGWQKYGADFIENFLGYSDFSKQCVLKNPEVLSFYYDPELLVLRVVAKKPLLIYNKALGYNITYWLDEFEQNYKTRIIIFKGSSLFEDRIKAKGRKSQAAKWLKNRTEAYNGSVMHFIRAVYAGDLAKSGFVVRRLDKVEGYRKGKYTNVVDPKELAEADFSESILTDSLTSQKIIQFTKYLYVLYNKELEELSYLKRQYLFNQPNPGPQTSIVQLVGTTAVEIFPNGHIEPAIAFFLEGYWAYEKLDKLLPLDYKAKGE
ncbi:MAG: carboxypeptidase-like regulatory domain-containing protein [Sediminibacterium sp.]|nr:carboxypeptidase-like regulatory domain-containing protein [Sediminibacterium sp.]